MANIPRCPNNKHSTAICGQSRLRLLGENDTSFVFTCSGCSLVWAVSKPKTKDKARWENQVRKVKNASEQERERAADRRAYSIPRG